jgi:hypothetical protein
MPTVTPPPGPPAGPAAEGVGRHVALVWAVACGEPAGRWRWWNQPRYRPLPSRSAAGIRQTRPNMATATKETPMRAAFLCYLAQAWTADRYPQAQRDAPARAASRTASGTPAAATKERRNPW